MFLAVRTILIFVVLAIPLSFASLQYPGYEGTMRIITGNRWTETRESGVLIYKGIRPGGHLASGDPDWTWERTHYGFPAWYLYKDISPTSGEWLYRVDLWRATFNIFCASLLPAAVAFLHYRFQLLRRRRTQSRASGWAPPQEH